MISGSRARSALTERLWFMQKSLIQARARARRPQIHSAALGLRSSKHCHNAPPVLRQNVQTGRCPI